MTQNLRNHVGKFAFILVVATLAFAQSGCSKSAANNIDITVVPSRPVVITADFQVLDPLNSTPDAPVYKTITGPWATFSYSVHNGYAATEDATQKTVTIVGIEADVTGFTITGQQVYQTSTFAVVDASGYVSGTSKPFLATVAPGAPDVNAGGLLDLLHAGNFYLQSLPSLTGATTGGTSSTPPPVLNTYNYQIRMTFTGWFGTYDAPQGRFTKTISISTQ